MTDFLDGKVQLLEGDAMEHLRELPDASVDSVVTDPPYHLTSIVKRFGADDAAPAKVGKTGAYARASRGFMGQQWDGGDIAFRPELWAEVLRVLKPGGYIVAFSSSRTFGRMSVAIEDAGFINHPLIGWIFGQGFPKAHRVEAEGYEGWRYGAQALKPALEPIYMGQKPFSEPTGTKNVLAHGTGALNIDGCRVGTERLPAQMAGQAKLGTFERTDMLTPERIGRWPANLVTDGSDEVLAAFPESNIGGGPKSAKVTAGSCWNIGGDRSSTPGGAIYGDSGSAARFFASFPLREDAPCLGMHHTQESSTDPANFAEPCIDLQSQAAVFALSRVVEASMVGLALNCTSFRAPSTSVTASEFETVCELLTETIQSFEKRFSRGLLPIRLSLTQDLAKCAAHSRQTDTIEITINLLRSNGSADSVTFSITRENLELGVRDSAKRFHYSSKADSLDRLGSNHPTVKPVDLMRWLVRLVTPKGGIVLDPFAGTGTTGEAAWREGMRAVLIEREAPYQADIARRMALCLAGPDERARASVKARYGDLPAGPLFDVL